MAAKHHFHHYLLGIIVVFGVGAFCQTRVTTPKRPLVSRNEEQVRTAVFDTASTQLYVRELKNQNDHPQITAYNREARAGSDRAFYCASGIWWCYTRNGVYLPIRSPSLVSSWFADQSKIIWRRNQRGSKRSVKPRTFDVVSLFNSHIEAVAPNGWDEENETVRIIGFNTTGGTGRGGVYVCRRYWRRNNVKLVANHLTAYLNQQP